MNIKNKINKIKLLFIIILFIIAVLGIVKVNVSAATFATVAQVRKGVTFYDSKVARQVGTMTDNGTINKTINLGDTYKIPEGYHSGSGAITASNQYNSTNLACNYIGELNGTTRTTTGTFDLKPNTRYFVLACFFSTMKENGWWEDTDLAVTNATVENSYSMGQRRTLTGYYAGMRTFTFKTNNKASTETISLILGLTEGTRYFYLYEVTY